MHGPQPPSPPCSRATTGLWRCHCASATHLTLREKDRANRPREALGPQHGLGERLCRQRSGSVSKGRQALSTSDNDNDAHLLHSKAFCHL